MEKKKDFKEAEEALERMFNGISFHPTLENSCDDCRKNRCSISCTCDCHDERKIDKRALKAALFCLRREQKLKKKMKVIDRSLTKLRVFLIRGYNKKIDICSERRQIFKEVYELSHPIKEQIDEVLGWLEETEVKKK